MRTVLVTCLLLVVTAAVLADDPASVVGRLGATDQEADEGYFALEGDVMVVARPGSDLQAWLRNATGKRVRLTIALEPD